MQNLSTPQNKTPAKKRLSRRKSFTGTPPGGQNGIAKSPTNEKNNKGAVKRVPFVKSKDVSFEPSPKKQAGVKTPQPNKTPKQKTPQKTPNVVQKTPNAVQNENKANNTGGKQKRKQSLVSSGDEGTSPKQQKLTMFAGTKKLNVSNDSKKKTPQPKKVNPQQKASPNTALSKKAQRIELSIKKRKERRNQIKHAFQELKEGRPVSPTFVNSVINAIQGLEKREKLTNSARRKLLTYKRLQKLINKVDANSTQVKANNKQQKNTKAPPAKQGKKFQKKPVLKETEEDADDSDYDTEKSVKVQKVARGLNETDSDDDDDDLIEEETSIKKTKVKGQKRNTKSIAKNKRNK